MGTAIGAKNSPCLSLFGKRLTKYIYPCDIFPFAFLLYCGGVFVDFLDPVLSFHKTDKKITTKIFESNNRTQNIGRVMQMSKILNLDCLCLTSRNLQLSLEPRPPSPAPSWKTRGRSTLETFFVQNVKSFLDRMQTLRCQTVPCKKLY